MFKVKHTGTTNKWYTVKGETLDEVWKDIQRKGPKEDGKKVAGLTTCPVEVDPASVKMDQTFTARKKGGFDAELFHKSGRLTYKCTILMPKLASDRKLSRDAKVEWKRFMGKLATHETGHVTVTGKEAKVIGGELDAMKSKGTGNDKRAAFNDAVKTYKKEFTAKYGGTKIEDRLKKVHKTYHVRGGHGPALDFSIE